MLPETNPSRTRVELRVAGSVHRAAGPGRRTVRHVGPEGFWARRTAHPDARALAAVIAVLQVTLRLVLRRDSARLPSQPRGSGARTICCPPLSCCTMHCAGPKALGCYNSSTTWLLPHRTAWGRSQVGNATRYHLACSRSIRVLAQNAIAAFASGGWVWDCRVLPFRRKVIGAIRPRGRGWVLALLHVLMLRIRLARPREEQEGLSDEEGKGEGQYAHHGMIMLR